MATAKVFTGVRNEYTIRIMTDRKDGERIIHVLKALQVRIDDPYNKLGGE